MNNIKHPKNLEELRDYLYDDDWFSKDYQLSKDAFTKERFLTVIEAREAYRKEDKGKLQKILKGLYIEEKSVKEVALEMGLTPAAIRRYRDEMYRYMSHPRNQKILFGRED